MNNKKLTILIAVVVIILAVILFAVLSNKKNAVAPTNNVIKSNPVVKESATATPEVEKVVVPEGVDASTMVPVIPKPLSAMPGSAEAPKQVVVETNNIPKSAIKLTLSDTGFTPKEFTVSAGQKVSLAISSESNSTHVFIFPNAALMALTMMISGGQTRVMEFTAPPAGIYAFRDDIPSFRNNTGTMIVK
ncbi:MAG: cupredoxin domain-containing protein [Candidatus Falkowbacteria bacterium]